MTRAHIAQADDAVPHRLNFLRQIMAGGTGGRKGCFVVGIGESIFDGRRFACLLKPLETGKHFKMRLDRKNTGAFFF